MCAALIDRDIVVPGVGVWHPRTRWLEGDVSRLVGSEVQQSIKRLTVRIHNPEDLPELLKEEKVAGVEQVTIVYIKGFSFHNLHAALGTAAFTPKKLQLFRVVGQVEGIRPWQQEEFGNLYRCLSGATLDICGMKWQAPFVRSDDIVFRDEQLGLDIWYRVRGNMVATDAKSFPWFYNDIVAAKPSELIINCDNQFLLMNKLFQSIEVLRLYNVKTTLTVICEFLRHLKLPRLRELHMTLIEDTARADTMRFWFQKLLHLNGVTLYLNGMRMT